MKSVGLVTVYFGEFPYYADLFFKSAKANPGVDFLILTDQTSSERRDGNVRFIPMTRRKFERLASRKLGASVRLPARPAGKICDYRPSFGVVLDDYLGGYDFWGHNDMDMIWGDFSRLLKESSLNRYDVISGDVFGLCGPFSLFRNKPEINGLFRKIKDFAGHASAPEYRHMDEDTFTRVILESRARFLRKKFWEITTGTFADLRRFAGSPRAYGSAVESMGNFPFGGERLPALWRAGRLKSFLPVLGEKKLLIMERLYLHLPRRVVSCAVDLKNDLIVPVPRTAAEIAELARDWHDAPAAPHR